MRNRRLRTDLVDKAVWNEVCRLTRASRRFEQEYHRRLLPKKCTEALYGLEEQIGRLRQGLSRLIASYIEGFIDKTEFKPRIMQIRDGSSGWKNSGNKIKD